MECWQVAKIAVLEAKKKLADRGFIIGTAGNVSLRLPPEDNRQLLAITPRGRSPDSLAVNDIQVIDFEGKPVEGDLKPSIETTLHIGIYQARPDVNAVIHNHSIYASAIAVAGLSIPPIVEDQVACLGGEIKLAPYAPSGSNRLVQNVIDALGERKAALLAHHGVVGVGRDMAEALTVCELIEKTAQIYYLALSLGSVKLIPAGRE